MVAPAALYGSCCEFCALTSNLRAVEQHLMGFCTNKQSLTEHDIRVSSTTLAGFRFGVFSAGVQGFGQADSQACLYVGSDGERGVLAQKPIPKGEIIVQVRPCVAAGSLPVSYRLCCPAYLRTFLPQPCCIHRIRKTIFIFIDSNYCLLCLYMCVAAVANICSPECALAEVCGAATSILNVKTL